MDSGLPPRGAEAALSGNVLAAAVLGGRAFASCPDGELGPHFPISDLRWDVLIVRGFALSLCRQKYEVALRLRCVLGLSWWQM